MSNSKSTEIVSRETISRLIKDITQIKKNPLTENGIYYEHDDSDMLKGYALIIGPEDTPYFGGYYFFEFKFPKDYPFSPPTIKYLTNDGYIRFNPNLYTNGKVCVSILNTWSGDQWSSCQTITSVLLTLCTLLNNEPLLNEPGITKSHPDLRRYNQIIHYSNISIAICDILSQKIKIVCYDNFKNVVHELFLKNYNKILFSIEENKELNNASVSVGFYRLLVFMDHALLKKKLADCKKLVSL